MIDLRKIQKPTLLLNESIARNNIKRMADKAAASSTIFRPHFKTHQSAQIGEWFRDYGVKKITVSSLTMASYFSRSGWSDITVAFPFNIREKELAKSLSSQITINLLVTNREAAIEATDAIDSNSGIYIEIDSGYGRSGVRWDNYDELDSILEAISKKESGKIKGFLTHAGNSYTARGRDEILTLFNESNYRMGLVAERYSNINPVISVGDTPGCSVAKSFDGLDEVRPGNFIFYDLTQTLIGSCHLDDVAVAVACPIVSIDKRSGRTVIYGGGVHLSKEALMISDGQYVYGLAAEFTNEVWKANWSNPKVVSLSQEHGIVDMGSLATKYKSGDLLPIIPVHSCLTADSLRRYLTTDGKIINSFSEK